VELYLHTPIRLYGAVLSYLLPLLLTVEYEVQDISCVLQGSFSQGQGLSSCMVALAILLRALLVDELATSSDELFVFLRFRERNPPSVTLCRRSGRGSTGCSPADTRASVGQQLYHLRPPRIFNLLAL